MNIHIHQVLPQVPHILFPSAGLLPTARASHITPPLPASYYSGLNTIAYGVVSDGVNVLTLFQNPDDSLTQSGMCRVLSLVLSGPFFSRWCEFLHKKRDLLCVCVCCVSLSVLLLWCNIKEWSGLFNSIFVHPNALVYIFDVTWHHKCYRCSGSNVWKQE